MTLFPKQFRWKMGKLTVNIDQMRFPENMIMPLFYRGIFCLLLLHCSTSIYGQKGNPVFRDISEALQQKPTFDWDIDTRNSFIAAKRAGVIGFKAGFDFGKSVRFGLGYNFLYTTVREQFVSRNSKGFRVNALQRFHMRYGSIYGEYVYYRKNNLKMTVQMLFGAGTSQFRFVDEYSQTIKSPWKAVFLYEPHMTGDYKILRFLSVGAGLGYRIVYSPNKFSRTRLNSPIYIIRANILLKELYDSLKSR